MTRLRIRHETRYTYERPVRFGPQRLMLRPRDSHAARIVEATLELSPLGAVRWVYDALGNCVCWYTPDTPSTELVIVSNLLIERFPAPLSPFEIGDPHTATPIVYDREDRTALEPFMAPATDDEALGLLTWLRSQMGRADEPALDFLLRLNSAIHQEFAYGARHDEGTQSPAETLRLGSGTCRDFAWLMVEGLRRLGYAARFVTGYLYSAKASKVRGASATHAWVEVFLPGLGWMEFDPTNGLAESPDLIAVASARTPSQAAPVSGSIFGDPGDSHLDVKVDVQLAGPVLGAA
ncbi:transglutaminase family protein [Caulobacter sp. NIBR2454]|uniref:transglutaminase family protein n=1 Tax=Caulobacter sp. NIBR2454 TaxID=3015996 RepID=UPI0022B743E5|nr:transglutaminase family protein [Caulobacter sp. NIBR2454]